MGNFSMYSSLLRILKQTPRVVPRTAVPPDAGEWRCQCSWMVVELSAENCPELSMQKWYHYFSSPYYVTRIHDDESITQSQERTRGLKFHSDAKCLSEDTITKFIFYSVIKS